MKRGEIWTVAGGAAYAGKPRRAVIVQDDRFDATVVCDPLLLQPLLAISDACTHRSDARGMADGKSLIALEGPGRGAQNFFQVDLQTGERRQLTNLNGGFAIQNFDVSLDGKHIVFDRVGDNSDIVLMNLAR